MDQNLTWNWSGLKSAFAFVLCLIASFLFPPTRYLWNVVDEQLFLLLNSWIATNALMQNIVAILNYKYFHWVHDTIFLLFFIIFIKCSPRERRPYRIAQILFAVILAALAIYISKTMLSGFARNSPSLYFPECTRLSEKVDWLAVKDYSRSSFPSGHGITACLFAGIIHILMKGRAGILATFYAMFLIAPRMIVGAHWLSDILVGSGVIAILTLAFGYCTPLAELFAQKVTKTSLVRKLLVE